MNFLAHCALAYDAAAAWACDTDEQQGLLAGAVIGDFIKGTIATDWPAPLIGGTRLHRKIDAWSNTNPNVKALSARYPEELRRYAPIFVDLIADYHLANRWAEHYPITLGDFTPDCYAAIGEYEAFLPANGKRFFSYMAGEDLLNSYDDLESIERGLHSVMRRLRKLDLYEPAVEHTRRTIHESEAEILALLSDLRDGLNVWNAFRGS